MTDTPGAGSGWLSLSDYAASRPPKGVNKSTISRWVASAAIPPEAVHRVGKTVLIHKAAADAALARNLNPNLSRKPDAPADAAEAEAAPASPPVGAPSQPPGPGASPPAEKKGLHYHTARSAKELWSAKKTQIEVQQLLGLLVDKRAVFDAYVDLGSRLRQALESRRMALAGELAGLPDVGAVAVALEAADDRMMLDLCAEFERAADLMDAAAAGARRDGEESPAPPPLPDAPDADDDEPGDGPDEGPAGPDDAV